MPLQRLHCDSDFIRANMHEVTYQTSFMLSPQICWCPPPPFLFLRIVTRIPLHLLVPQIHDWYEIFSTLQQTHKPLHPLQSRYRASPCFKTLNIDYSYMSPLLCSTTFDAPWSLQKPPAPSHPHHPHRSGSTSCSHGMRCMNQMKSCS